MRYPFTPELLDALPEPLAELFRGLEITLLEEICSRLVISEEANEPVLQSIRALKSHGIDQKAIDAAIREVTGLSQKKLDEIFGRAVERNQAYYTELIDLAKVTQPDALVDAAFIESIRAQTHDEFRNITQSMGFMVRRGAQSVLLPPGKAYQWALDSAELQIQSSAISYQQAIRSAVRQLADSGLKVVTYDSGHRDHVDVAVRRAVMTGISQLCAKYTERAAEVLDTDYYEISAHRGARDTGVGWQNHKNWQGKVYSVRAGDKYPNIYEVCGLGEVDGLEGANCRHRRFVFLDGITERTYTDEYLANIDPPPFEFEGRTYTMYAATQKQREIERNVRAAKRLEASHKAHGDKEAAGAARTRRLRLSKKYTEFSKAAELPEQRDRMRVDYTYE